ncbi:MAG: hypothetical protein M1819_000187 [Sarea resinae]|nr:MAG: hypothetical protein M1819_000187 [Sarea resinae]
MGPPVSERPPSHHASPSAPVPPAASSSSSSSSTSSTRLKQLLPAAGAAPPPPPPPPPHSSSSSLDLRSKTSSLPAALASPVRRKPLPSTVSPLVSRFSSGEHLAGSLAHRIDHSPRAASLDNPLPESVDRAAWSPDFSASSRPFEPRDLNRFPHGQSPLVATTLNPSDDAKRSDPDKDRVHSPQVGETGVDELDSRRTSSTSISSSIYGYDTEEVVPLPSVYLDTDRLDDDRGHDPNQTGTMPLYPSNQGPNLQLHLDAGARSLPDPSHEALETSPSSKPKSPGSKLTSFFGWKASSPGAESSVTSFSDRTPSGEPSPLSTKSSAEDSFPTSRAVPAAIDIPRANRSLSAPFTDSSMSFPPPTPAMAAEVGEIEDELREISSELASSIRREMDLEDLVERLQMEASQPSEMNRRTSDYFSDSGTSSVRYGMSDTDAKIEELEKLRRKTEQEKAQLQVDLANKVQDERAKRKALESHIYQLEEQAQRIGSDQVKSSDASSSRVKELETCIEDFKRRLSEERQVKDNFEDLLSALKGELEENRNERDNLRDEIVPQLRARVEGLEAEAAQFQKLNYENSRMQQELQSLRNENTTLVNNRRLQLEMQQHQSRFSPISEEGDPMKKVGLTRSNSLARASLIGPSRSRPTSLSRSGSVKERGPRESRESLADRVKDIEAQRDALHRALKSLLERQFFQDRETAKKVKALEAERDRAMNGSPRRIGYYKEVSQLREEITHLRRRADDALEQKWQCEKGLSGLKMDLDRAEQETSSLRILLQGRDIMVPDASEGVTEDPAKNILITSVCLEKAYQELRTTHALSLARLDEMQHGQAGGAGDDAEKTMKLLLQSISDAEAERESAQKQAEEYRLHAQTLQESEQYHLSEEQSMAGDLCASARRVEELATHVRKQLDSNSLLRDRLAEAIGRGEREQKVSAVRITEMQGKLKSLEDKVMAAQQHSEDTVSKHEEEVRELNDTHKVQLQRIRNGLLSPAAFTPKSPMSPLFSARSPRLDLTTSGLGMSMTEATKTEFLEKKVDDLERALRDADKEMEQVVGRMNMAQIEVAELQTERYDFTERL